MGKKGVKAVDRSVINLVTVWPRGEIPSKRESSSEKEEERDQ